MPRVLNTARSYDSAEIIHEESYHETKGKQNETKIRMENQESIVVNKQHKDEETKHAPRRKG